MISNCKSNDALEKLKVFSSYKTEKNERLVFPDRGDSVSRFFEEKNVLA